jgi:AcrR family transcriptional regulator
MARDDPRLARSRRTILAATVNLLAEHGFGGATVEAIAARSGAAKTTIYRHWPQKRDLLLAAVESVVPRAEGVDTGDVLADVNGFLAEMTEVLNTSPLAAIIPAMIEAAERDQDFARLLAEFTAERRRPIIAALERGVARGELGAESDPEILASLLLGPLFYRRLLSRHPVTPAFASQVAEAVLNNRVNARRL